MDFMGCFECALGPSASAIEMAFSANLLFTALGGFYNFLEDRQKTLRDDADNLENNPYIQEELSIETLRETINSWGIWRQRLWKAGLFVSLGSALFLYLITWHFFPGPICESWFWWPSMYFAAWVGPALLGLMAAVGAIGNKRASNLNEKLQQQVKKKQQQQQELSDEAQQKLRELQN